MYFPQELILFYVVSKSNLSESIAGTSADTELIAEMATIFSNAPSLSDNIVLFRGILRVEDLPRIGEPIIDKGYISLTPCLSRASEFAGAREAVSGCIMEFVLPKDTPYFYLGYFTGPGGDENEILIPPGVWKIVGLRATIRICVLIHL